MEKTRDTNDLTPENKETVARDNFNNWNSALLSKDPHKVAEIYTEDNTFLPTMSPEFKKGKTGAKEYFHHFLESNPTGKIIQDHVQILGQDSYLHSGMYNFEVGHGNERKEVPARFTYVWKMNPVTGAWQIVHHHSSVKPK